VTKAFLRFDLSALAGRTLTSVKLRVTTTADSSAGSTGRHTVKWVADTRWKERWMSADNTVAVSSTILGDLPANTLPGRSYEITLDRSVVQRSAGGLFSLALETASSDGLVFFSRESGSAPRLVVAA
jgi:3-phytase